MSMTLRIVIPPHPLIGHWLSILRIDSTPPAIYATALSQLGKWLTYEALRDWLPHDKKAIITERGETEGIFIDTNVPIIVSPNLPGGLELWQGAREILPNASLCIGRPAEIINSNAGVILYLDQITDGDELIQSLNTLKDQNVSAIRIRVITVIAASKGLKEIGVKFPDLTIYAACIDPELNEKNEIRPGIGNPTVRLNTIITSPH